MIDYLTSFEFISMLALFVYWLPASICFVVYFVRSIKAYKLDLTRCSDKFYNPALTIGVIAWWLILSITPGVNLFALVFDCASSVFKTLGGMLNIPLVPKRAGSDA